MGAIPRTRSASVRDGRQCLFLAKRFNIAHSESRKIGVDVGKRRFNGVLSRGGRSFEVEETSKSPVNQGRTTTHHNFEVLSSLSLSIAHQHKDCISGKHGRRLKTETFKHRKQSAIRRRGDIKHTDRG